MLVSNYLNMVEFEGFIALVLAVYHSVQYTRNPNVLLGCYVNLVYRNLVNCQLQEQVHNRYCSPLFSLILFYLFFKYSFSLLFCN